MKPALAAILTSCCLAVAACGGGDDSGPGDTLGALTPVGTKQQTEPAATDGTSGPPSPAEPGLDEQLTLFLDGQLFADILPGDSYEVDPEVLAAHVGTPPSCENFQFSFSWQVVDPFPPDGVALTWQLEREGGAVEVASGPSGSQAIGCGVLNIVNGGGAPLSVNVRYRIGGR